MLVLGIGLSGCGGDEEGNSSGMAGSVDLTEKPEVTTVAKPKTAGGLRGQSIGGPEAPDQKKGRR